MGGGVFEKCTSGCQGQGGQLFERGKTMGLFQKGLGAPGVDGYPSSHGKNPDPIDRGMSEGACMQQSVREGLAKRVNPSRT